MPDEDLKFEEYLRSFQPIKPGLLQPVASISFAPRRIAAGVAAAALIGLLAWLSIGRESTITPRRTNLTPTRAEISAGALTRIALEDGKQFDIQLDEMAPSIWPCCSGPRSSLAVLAKE